MRIEAFEELDFRLCELSVEESVYKTHTIVFYTPLDDWRCTRRPQDWILLFCIFMDPRTKKMTYLGSVEVVEDSSLHSVCFGDICSLDEGMRDIECSFFCMHPEDRITRIRKFQKTIKEVCSCLSDGLKRRQVRD